MKQTGIIKAVGAERSGVSKRTGETWFMTPVVMEWTEENQNLTQSTYSMVIDVKGRLDMEKVKACMRSKSPVAFSAFPEANEFNGRWFNNLRGYLAADLMLK